MVSKQQAILTEDAMTFSGVENSQLTITRSITNMDDEPKTIAFDYFVDEKDKIVKIYLKEKKLKLNNKSNDPILKLKGCLLFLYDFFFEKD